MHTSLSISIVICFALINISNIASAEGLEALAALSPNNKFHGQWASDGAIGPAQIELEGNGRIKLVTGDCNGTQFAGNSSIRITHFDLVESHGDRFVFEAQTSSGTRRDTYILIDGGMFRVEYDLDNASGTITKIARYGLDNPGLMCKP